MILATASRNATRLNMVLSFLALSFDAIQQARRTVAKASL